MLESPGDGSASLRPVACSPKPGLTKILIANRGEIAVRIIRACRELGLASVAVYSECDRAAEHVLVADEAVPIGPSAPAESYLSVPAIIDAARRAGADAIHPGYGFLAENPEFASACREAGLVFIGPTPEAMARMGSKTAARTVARAAGVPVVPGTETAMGPEAEEPALVAAAEAIGYPLLVKAVAGGGGKGMRTVDDPRDLVHAVRAARSEALTSFGDAAVYFERRLDRPRHVEVQVLADRHGTVRSFVERECSIQRRHQKVVEESPSIAVPADVRPRLLEAAEAVVRAAGYTNAGTLEFLLDTGSGAFYFLEMNTRLQVEHPVTEVVTGVDLVHWQIRIARGEPLTLDPAALASPRGHAIECRVYAEDPDNRFLPSPGRIRALLTPSGPGVRIDSGVASGADVPVFYDPLISKLIVWGRDRSEALARLARALDEYAVIGVKTTLPFFRWLVRTPEFAEGRFDTTFLDRVLQDRNGQPFESRDPEVERMAAVAAAIYAFNRRTRRSVDRIGPERASAWAQAARIGALRDL